MKPIGGYFELADREQGDFIHKQGVLLNTGRNALKWILLSIGNVRKVYLPYYTCDVVLAPLRQLNISWQFYSINNELEIDDVSLGNDEYIIVNNYFGIKDAYIAQMVTKYGSHIIIDCAQAFFAPVISGVKMFYSPRKFLGVADGGVAYGVTGNTDALAEYDSSNNSDHLIIRKKFGAEAGFLKYKEDESVLDNQPVQRMSSFSRDILEHINYGKVISVRRCNYLTLDKALSHNNLLHLPAFESFTAPMAYPLMIKNGSELRRKLIEKKVFVPRFWPNKIIPEAYCGNCQLSEDVLPLPIDQRYREEDMDRIVEIINN